jgi:hypothetical protein
VSRSKERVKAGVIYSMALDLLDFPGKLSRRKVNRFNQQRKYKLTEQECTSLLIMADSFLTNN